MVSNAIRTIKGGKGNISKKEVKKMIRKLGDRLALPLAVFVVVIPIMCAEKVELLNFIPAWFMGAAVFFALQFMSGAGTMAEYADIAIPEMIACIVGLGFGYCTVSFRTWYEKKVMPQTEETAEQAKKSA